VSHLSDVHEAVPNFIPKQMMYLLIISLISSWMKLLVPIHPNHKASVLLDQRDTLEKPTPLLGNPEWLCMPCLSFFEKRDQGFSHVGTTVARISIIIFIHLAIQQEV
jgi:hypothetical protein